MFLLLQAALVWQMASLARSNAMRHAAGALAFKGDFGVHYAVGRLAQRNYVWEISAGSGQSRSPGDIGLTGRPFATPTRYRRQAFVKFVEGPRDC
jgi:hypothetical protein